MLQAHLIMTDHDPKGYLFFFFFLWRGVGKTSHGRQIGYGLIVWDGYWDQIFLGSPSSRTLTGLQFTLTFKNGLFSSFQVKTWGFSTETKGRSSHGFWLGQDFTLKLGSPFTTSEIVTWWREYFLPCKHLWKVYRSFSVCAAVACSSQYKYVMGM